MEKIVCDESIRIDLYLSKKTDYSRSTISKMIKNKTILVNGKEIKNSYQLKIGDIIEVGEYKEENMNIEPENIPIEIVYEDDDVIVVDKPNGMVVHPAVGNAKGTLVNALLYHSKNLSDINGEFRPGIVHRIDAYTTGLLMVAKNNKSHEILSEELSKKETSDWDNEEWLLEEDYSAYHVVDGQQRLTTMIILINEIVNYYRYF